MTALDSSQSLAQAQDGPSEESNRMNLISGAPSRLGGRVLTTDRDPWTHNAWDNVEWDEEQSKAAEEAIEKQQANPVTAEQQEKYNGQPHWYWDKFYMDVKDTFFKDRSWLAEEFPELEAAMKPDAGPKKIVEIGCGPGNTLFPILKANQNPHLFVHALDFSRQAIKLVKRNASYPTSPCLAEIWDISAPSGPPESIPEGSCDVVILIFVLSALHPKEWARAVGNVWKMLKPGGIVLFRDYGRHDMAQLRFKGSRWMEPNLYARGDCTRVYFFSPDEISRLFSPSSSNDPNGYLNGKTSLSSEMIPALENLQIIDTAKDSLPEIERTNPSSSNDQPQVRTPTILREPSNTHSPVDPEPPNSTNQSSSSSATTTTGTESESPRANGTSIVNDDVVNYGFKISQLGVDRRLLLNRLRKLKMYRVWLQGKFVKRTIVGDDGKEGKLDPEKKDPKTNGGVT